MQDEPIQYEFKHWARAIAGSIPDTGFLLCITGGAGAGKSSLTAELSQQYGYLACYPGRHVRKTFAGVLPGDLGQMAPASCDDIVKEHIADSVVMAGRNSLIIDGFPRSRAQMKWIEEVSIKAVKRIAVIVVQANPSIRAARIRGRGEAYDVATGVARMRQEEDDLQPFLRWLPTVADVYIEIANGVE